MQEIKDLSAYRQSLKVKILETATKAFLSRGIKAVKMDDIASALSISKRTVYEIYGDKESLLFECIKDGHEKRHREMTEFAEQHNVMETVLEVYRRKVEEFSTVNHAFYEDVQLYPQVMDYVEEKRQSSHQYFISFIRAQHWAGIALHTIPLRGTADEHDADSDAGTLHVEGHQDTGCSDENLMKTY